MSNPNIYNERSPEGMEPNKKLQQLILNPEKYEWESPPFPVYSMTKNTPEAFGTDLGHCSFLLLNLSSPFPDQSHGSHKAKAKDNSLLPLSGTCLNLHSKFSGQHIFMIWFHKAKQKKWDGVVRDYLKIVFLQGFWMGCLDFTCLSTKSFFT